jgi:cell division protein FtsZ
MSEMGKAMMGTGVARGEDRARVAAETAIRCPLLEDINLQGARGVLVNVTAGLDLGLAEFDEIGQIINAFASDSATIVVGTAIDTEMNDEIRVTVVATGLGTIERPVKVVDNTINRKPIYGDAVPDYRGLDRPAVHRTPSNRVTGSIVPGTTSVAAVQSAPVESEEDDYLDIPAFLRRQVD